MISEFRLIFLCGVMSLNMYSRVKGWSSYAPERRWRGVCSKNNWNTECILNMCHTPIFRIIVWFINLNYLLNGESIIMGQNKNFQFLHTAIIIVTLITAIAIFGWVFYCWKPRKKLVNFYLLIHSKTMVLTEKDSQTLQSKNRWFLFRVEIRTINFK